MFPGNDGQDIHVIGVTVHDGLFWMFVDQAIVDQELHEVDYTAGDSVVLLALLASFTDFLHGVQHWQIIGVKRFSHPVAVIHLLAGSLDAVFVPGWQWRWSHVGVVEYNSTFESVHLLQGALLDLDLVTAVVEDQELVAGVVVEQIEGCLRVVARSQLQAIDVDVATAVQIRTGQRDHAGGILGLLDRRRRGLDVLGGAARQGEGQGGGEQGQGAIHWSLLGPGGFAN